MDVNEETLELIERRISERVTERVRKKLFWVYSIIGGGVIGGLAFLGVDLFDTIKERAATTAESSARAIVNNEIQPLVASAESIAADAEKQVIKAHAQLEYIASAVARREAEVEQAINRLRPAIADMNVRLDEVQAALDRADQQFQRNEDIFASAGNFADLSKGVADLAQQMSDLDAAIAQLRERRVITSIPDPGLIDSPAQMTISSVAETARAFSPQLTPTDQSTTVFVQYAGGQSKLISRIEGLLVNLYGYSVPGAERVETAADLAEVRFFFDSDSAAAEQLATDVKNILSELDVEYGVRPVSLVDFKGKKPRPGVLELWLEPKPR